jgi:hypothetical protein
MALVYQNGETQLNAFVDSDYAGDTVGRKSMSGYFVKIGDAACIWGTKKADCVFWRRLDLASAVPHRSVGQPERD